MVYERYHEFPVWGFVTLDLGYCIRLWNSDDADYRHGMGRAVRPGGDCARRFVTVAWGYLAPQAGLQEKATLHRLTPIPFS